ncbi:MAG: hypothetical protein SFU83_21865 [Meiothermus sp.]|nr:hypothetical protein [Meiothermus sp.]
MNKVQALLAGLLVLSMGAAFAQTAPSASQSVSVTVQTLEEIAVSSGGEVSDSISNPDVIRAGNYTRDIATELTYTTNADANRKITAAASYTNPAGTSFSASVLASGFTASNGSVALSGDAALGANPVDLVSGIKNVAWARANFTLRVAIPDVPLIQGSYQVSVVYTLMGY